MDIGARTFDLTVLTFDVQQIYHSSCMVNSINIIMAFKATLLQTAVAYVAM